MLWKGLGFRLSTGLWHLSRTLSTLRSQSSLFMLPGFYIPLTLPCPQGPLPSLTLQSTKENPHVCLLLASAPLSLLSVSAPASLSLPLPHPKGTHYPSPTHSPRHCFSICLSSLQWPVTSFYFPCDCS